MKKEELAEEIFGRPNSDAEIIEGIIKSALKKNNTPRTLYRWIDVDTRNKIINCQKELRLNTDFYHTFYTRRKNIQIIQVVLDGKVEYFIQKGWFKKTRMGSGGDGVFYGEKDSRYWYSSSNLKTIVQHFKMNFNKPSKGQITIIKPQKKRAGSQLPPGNPPSGGSSASNP